MNKKSSTNRLFVSIQFSSTSSPGSARIMILIGEITGLNNQRLNSVSGGFTSLINQAGAFISDAGLLMFLLYRKMILILKFNIDMADIFQI